MLRLSQGRTYTAPVVARALDILEFMTEYPSPLKLDEIAKGTRVSRSTTYRILGTLEQRGYVSRSLDGRYSYCKSRMRQTKNAVTDNLLAFQPSKGGSEEVLWVERTLESLVSLLQQSRRENAAPIPINLEVLRPAGSPRSTEYKAQ